MTGRGETPVAGVIRGLLGLAGLATALAAGWGIATSRFDALVIGLGAAAVVLGTLAGVGRGRRTAWVAGLTALSVGLGCLTMVGQVGLSMAGMFGHEVPGYHFNAAHKRLGTDEADEPRAEPSPTAQGTRPQTGIDFPQDAHRAHLNSGVTLRTAVRAESAPDDAQPGKYAGKTVAMVYVRIVNDSKRSYSPGYPAMYCRAAGEHCYDVYSEAMALSGVEPFNESIAPGKSKTFRMAYAVPKKAIGSLDLRLTFDGARDNPYRVRG
ncbi:hypothetical protein NQ038_10525 [Brevibacterium sp. 50QC2O2]|uniref:hypothetical protein n=1 Tax=Brevibacterium TaxID=1696 RepID=UPI00211C6C1F|nr:MULTISPECIES: hypothetical protein [unclassified Brevibacterium]MCQ9366921.1 hypothetical protein [Brevibacterium sp. 91QC2O2]MCQ9384071.1 hypothetical protein [Brevibacterium sp. 68QC2CO]MCQ9389075.1 hypothetical protein [Brevibacterium sp. 50QC2O2]